MRKDIGNIKAILECLQNLLKAYWPISLSSRFMQEEIIHQRMLSIDR